MQALVLVTLAERSKFTFAQPLLAWLKKELPALQLVDIDNFSDSILVAGACRLVQEADQRALYFKVEPENIPLGASLKLLETVLQPGKPTLLLLEGKHRQLAAICSARPHLKLIQSENEANLREKLLVFFSKDNGDT